MNETMDYVHSSLWISGQGPSWLRAFKLPTHNWVRHFFEPLRFPSVLCSQAGIFKPIYAQAYKSRKSLIEEKLRGKGHFLEIEILVMKTFVSEAIESLKASVGELAAEEFKYWAYRNLASGSEGELFAWMMILRHACIDGNHPWKPLIPPPKSLLNLQPQILEHIRYGKRKETDVEIDKLSLQQEDDWRKDIEYQSDLPPESYIVSEIIRNEDTRDALRIVIDNLSAAERREVESWAKSQSVNQGFGHLSFSLMRHFERPNE